jgi:replicative DNA helicase Mcm
MESDTTDITDIADKCPDVSEEQFDYFWYEVVNHPNQLSFSEKFRYLSLDEINQREEHYLIRDYIKNWTEKWTRETKEEVKSIASYDMNSNSEGKKVKIRGMVYRVADIFNEVYADVYNCSNCHEEFKVSHNQKINRCELCFSGDGLIKKKELHRDFIEMEIEEMPEEITKQPGRVKIKIYNPLVYTTEVKQLQPGEVITVTGMVKKDKIKVKNSREIFEYYLVMEGLELENKKGAAGELTEEDINKIAEISKNNPLEKLAKSLAPGIYDMEAIKKSIVLQMVRGPEDNEELRPRIHILMVGEAGVAKSQLANQSHKKMPRSIYGSGDNMSKAGLSSSMEKEEMTGRWLARAGILCRANKSVVVIDEFDKLSKDDMAGLHTPMEKGESLVSKAGVHLSLKADCSILACCNPKNGSFLDLSGYESIASQVNIPIPILNRFDLIFMLRDIVNEDRDKQIIKAMFKKGALPEVDVDLFKKYIHFASQINPEIPEEVQETIEEIYTKLRKSSLVSKETKVNPRIPRSIASLAVACAKVRLSNEVSLDDVHVAENIMMESFKSLGFGNGMSGIDMASLYSNTTTKKLQIDSKVRDLIKNKIIEYKDKGKRADWDEIKQDILELGYAEKELDKVFFTLKKEGTLRGEDYKLIWN